MLQDTTMQRLHSTTGDGMHPFYNVTGSVVEISASAYAYSVHGPRSTYSRNDVQPMSRDIRG